MKGTINDIERSKIKEHASNTLDILSEIPFPQDYSDILDIVKTHKNIMKEKKNNNQQDSSKTTALGKIIAFASVFEQLSSSETPYNETKKLSEILKIMQSQKNSGLLDADLYSIFIKNEIYIDYAKEYLNPSQIDEINIEDILIISDDLDMDFGRIRLDYAVNEFIRHCRLRNLSQETQKYYQEDLPVAAALALLVSTS